MPSFYEFFAGGGMARAGLGRGWKCLFANDFDLKKSKIYQKNWGNNGLKTVDVGDLVTTDIPGQADLVWGSFPCQDLSLAGAGAGLKGDRSGTFWPFWRLMQALIADGRAPSIIALENVCGTLTSHGGKDFSAICSALKQEGYKFGAAIIDAALFVPHSRPRLFIIGIHPDAKIPQELSMIGPSTEWHTSALCKAYGNLSQDVKNSWIWWNLPSPPKRNSSLSDLIEHSPSSVRWHTMKETQALLDMMNGTNLAKVEAAKRSGKPMIGCIYKRTRHDEVGCKVQRAEIRFDDIAGCLRTPAGGSSRQLILSVDGSIVKSRLISSRETARLMGLPDDYSLPENYNEAYHLTGDGVVVPVVRHLAAHIFEPIFSSNNKCSKVAA